MSTDPERSSTRPTPGGVADADAARFASTRRQLLLKGIGKGSAVLAAAAPIKSLAFTPAVTANGKICTLSGVQSAAHSQSTGFPTCAGLSPGYYKQLSHWPNFNSWTNTATNTVGVKTFTQNTQFNLVFGSGPTQSLIFILQNQPSTAEFHWIAALLNAIKAPPGYVFPYSAQEVLDLYAGPQRAAALDFFKGYMETV